MLIYHTHWLAQRSMLMCGVQNLLFVCFFLCWRLEAAVNLWLSERIVLNQHYILFATLHSYCLMTSTQSRQILYSIYLHWGLQILPTSMCAAELGSIAVSRLPVTMQSWQDKYTTATDNTKNNNHAPTRTCTCTHIKWHIYTIVCYM